MGTQRLIHILTAFLVCFGLLGGRLFWLQTTAGAERPGVPSVAASAVRQRTAGVTLDPGRGHFADRDGEPLTGVAVEGLLLLPGGPGQVAPAELRALADALGTDAARLAFEWSLKPLPRWWNAESVGNPAGEPSPLSPAQAEAIRRLRVPGAVVAAKTNRYPADRLAARTVGFVAEQPERMAKLYGDRLRAGALAASTPIGASGLELAFDRFLSGNDAERIVTMTDGRGDRLDGLGVRRTGGSNRYYPITAVTTLDADVQRRVEAIAVSSGLREGAIVVLDAATSDVVAASSFPGDGGGSARPGDAALRHHHALEALPPGSVMKTLVAAAALEEGVVAPDTPFFCDGAYPRYGLTCWKEGGHGHLTFAEAIAQSCNVAFADVGERLGGPTLARYAERLGLVGMVGWSGRSAVDGEPLRQWPEEQPSRLFAGEPSAADGGALAQTAIGQRDARWSALAAANWVATLLRGGSPASPRIVSELRFADGHAMERYAAKRLTAERTLSPSTVAALKRMMEAVVAEGTGTSLRDAAWPLAGKSGTAEAAVGGRPVVHQWFVGYGPADRPRYVVAALAMNRPPGSSNQATALFGAVMDALASLERANAP